MEMYVYNAIAILTVISYLCHHIVLFLACVCLYVRHLNNTQSEHMYISSPYQPKPSVREAKRSAQVFKLIGDQQHRKRISHQWYVCAFFFVLLFTFKYTRFLYLWLVEHGRSIYTTYVLYSKSYAANYDFFLFNSTVVIHTIFRFSWFSILNKLKTRFTFE